MDVGFYATLLLAYLLGSIPFGLLLTRAAGMGDIRAIGSGNIGATNVMRTGNKRLAIITLLLDLGKGVAAVWIAKTLYSENAGALAGLFAVLGHIFPIWLRFKGGKGVSTALGVFLALNWMLALSVCALWLAVFFISRFSSLASIMSIGYSSVAAYLLDNTVTALLCLGLAGLIIFTHRKNIERLMLGTEPAFRESAT